MWSKCILLTKNNILKESDAVLATTLIWTNSFSFSQLCFVPVNHVLINFSNLLYKNGKNINLILWFWLILLFCTVSWLKTLCPIDNVQTGNLTVEEQLNFSMLRMLLNCKENLLLKQTNAQNCDCNVGFISTGGSVSPVLTQCGCVALNSGPNPNTTN